MKLVHNNDYIDLLSRSENDLLLSLNGLSKERFYFKPSKSSWSVYECLVHILITEKNISKIINLESYSDIKLRQNVGMEKIIEYMDSPENFSSPDFSLPNNENIKKLFDDESTVSILGLEKISGGVSDVSSKKNYTLENSLIRESKSSKEKTYEVIFGNKGRKLQKEEESFFKVEKKRYAYSSKELYPKKESPHKDQKNPFSEKYDRNYSISKSSYPKNSEKSEFIYPQLTANINQSKDPFSAQKNIKELMSLFIGIRDEMINFFLMNPDEDLNTFYFAHPVLGDLTKEEWLFYLASHTNRHRKQIENIKIHLPFAI